MKEGFENTFLLYHDKDGKADVSVRFANEDVWVTQVQLAELYETSQQNISLHIDNIYKDGELPKEATHKDFLLVQQEGKRQVRRKIAHYNLDVIIAIGYRVQSFARRSVIFTSKSRISTRRPLTMIPAKKLRRISLLRSRTNCITLFMNTLQQNLYTNASIAKNLSLA
jgi:hypothetical protein